MKINRFHLSVLFILSGLIIIGLDEPKYFFIEVQFILLISLLTLFTRSVKSENGILFFAIGSSLSVFALLGFGQLAEILGINSKLPVMTALFLPFLEEILKILPVILFAIWRFKKHRFRLNISDFLFLAVLTAAGFSMIEKTYWENIHFNFTYGPHVGGFYFFSDALGITVKSKTMGYIGHAAATGFIALGIGLGLYLKKLKIFQKFYWILPVVCFFWVLLEHSLYNLHYANGSNALLFFGGGIVTPWLFVILLVTTLILEFKLARKAVNLSLKIKGNFHLLHNYFKDKIKQIKEFKFTWFLLYFDQVRLLNLVAWHHHHRDSKGRQ